MIESDDRQVSPPFEIADLEVHASWRFDRQCGRSCRKMRKQTHVDGDESMSPCGLQLQSSIMSERRSKHSRKPICFYEWIEDGIPPGQVQRRFVPYSLPTPGSGMSSHLVLTLTVPWDSLLLFGHHLTSSMDLI